MENLLSFIVKILYKLTPMQGGQNTTAKKKKNVLHISWNLRLSKVSGGDQRTLCWEFTESNQTICSGKTIFFLF